jgi:hypothetical protein
VFSADFPKTFDKIDLYILLATSEFGLVDFLCKHFKSYLVNPGPTLIALQSGVPQGFNLVPLVFHEP